jgi:endonuclease YncB( thermonuclease family)
LPYTLLRGKFVIRYDDIPRQGPEPDGDTVKFMPDTPGLVETLPRPSGSPPGINSRGISVRLEAIDALETHFEETHQALGAARAARDALLAGLGFRNITYFTDLPNKVENADQSSLPGYVLSNGIDANGRMIGFVYPGSAPAADGASVFLDNQGVDQSENSKLLTAGLAYPAFYATLPASLRDHLAGSSRAARAARAGLWATATADPNGKATIADLQGLEGLVLWPKLFRRLVPYLAAGNTTFDGFDGWLRADPIHRDDRLLLLSDPVESGNMHDIIAASASQVQLTRWPEDFVIEPDPPAPGTTTGSRRYTAGDVVIVAALPDPVGADLGHESASLVNVTATDIDVQGWNLADRVGHRQVLSGTIPGGDIMRITLSSGLALGNRGGSLTLTDASGATIDKVSYTQAQVKQGRTLVFGRH